MSSHHLPSLLTDSTFETIGTLTTFVLGTALLWLLSALTTCLLRTKLSRVRSLFARYGMQDIKPSKLDLYVAFWVVSLYLAVLGVKCYEAEPEDQWDVFVEDAQKYGYGVAKGLFVVIALFGVSPQGPRVRRNHLEA